MTDQSRLVEDVLGTEVEPFAQGGESRTFRIVGDDLLVTVPLDWPGRRASAQEIARRAALLQRLEERLGVPVPQVVHVLAEHGLLVVRRLPGDRLIHAAPKRRRAARQHVADTLGTLLGELHTWDSAEYADLVATDRFAPEEWLQETAGTAARLAPLLDRPQRRDLGHFLAEPAPEPARRLVLSHNDLGIEHVLVTRTGGAPTVAGVIDWDDAAVCDPALDFGLLFRDLGPGALETALAAYAAAGGDAQDVTARAGFYARCKLLEDLAFGHDHGRSEYVDKSLSAWEWTFRAHDTR